MSRQESSASYHAQVGGNSILAYALEPKDLRAPMKPTSRSYRDLAAFVHSRILLAPVVRVKIWSPNGTVLFSDEPRLVGQRFGVDQDLRDAFGGRVHAGVSNLSDSENVFERSLAQKLYEA